jgi:Flp pilus assembly protein TadD
MTGAIEHYRQGLALYGRREYAAAIAEYRHALAERPEWSDCLQALGMAQMHAGDLRAALATLQHVTELAPEDPLAFTSLSMCLQRLERIPEAEKAQAQARLLSWKQELKKNPNAPPPSTGTPVQG